MSAFKIKDREGTIFRAEKNKDNPYVMIDRRPIANPKLSYKAKGILAYLLSRPDGWEVNVPDLVNHSPEGASAIRSGLKELREVGHLVYNRIRAGGYIKKWVIEVYELPSHRPEFDQEAEGVLDCDFQQVGNQQVGNRTQLSIESKVIKKAEESKPPTATAESDATSNLTDHQKRVYEFCLNGLRYSPATALKRAHGWNTLGIYKEELEKLAKLKDSQPARDELHRLKAKEQKPLDLAWQNLDFAKMERTGKYVSAERLASDMLKRNTV
jgi:hypothetical protein